MTEHDIELCLAEWRSHLVLNYLNSCSVTYDLTALSERINSSYVKSYGSIELKCTTTCCNLRVTEHNSNLLSELIDKYDNTVGLADNSSELSERL